MRASAWTVGEIASAVGGELVGDPDVRVEGVSTDTRDPLKKCLFIAIVGEKFDGHEFLAEAVRAGAGAVLVARKGIEAASTVDLPVLPSRVPMILAEDTLRALGDLAAHHRRKFSIPVVALTGSNGKTTTKEMIASIFQESVKVLKTEGNLNNLVGLPMTLLGLTKDHQAAVIEMGMNSKGEIARYCEIAKPDVGLVLNVGPAHIGMLGSLEDVADAKGELYFGLDKKSGVAVVNADDPQVVRVAQASGVKHVRTFGTKKGAEVRLLETTPWFEEERAGQKIRLEVMGQEISVDLSIPGAHNALNAAAAIAVARLYFADRAQYQRGLGKAATVARRMKFERVGPYLVVDDCYNANSASMKAAIETVASRGGRFVAVLGEMRELGDFSEAEHTAVGEALVRAKAEVVAAFGALAKPIADVAERAGIQAHHEAQDDEALWKWLMNRLHEGDVILVKGSRGMKMERFIERLRKEHP